MKVEAREARAADLDTPLLVVPWWEGDVASEALNALDVRLGGALGRATAEGGDFRGKKDETLLLYGGEGGPRRVLLIGAGPRADLTGERLRAVGGRAAGRARELRSRELDVWLASAGLPAELDLTAAARALTEGLVLGSWHFDELRTEFESGAPAEIERAGVLVAAGEAGRASSGIEVGAVVARAQNYARDLVARPANVVTPSYLAEEARRSGAELGFEVSVLDRPALEEEGLRCILAVAAGSDQEPRLIVMRYAGGAADERPLALVGKGVTFDSGGLSLKTSEGMESMKYDMAGGAAVIGAMRAIAELRLPVSVIGLVPSVENLPSGHAMRPGDVIRSHSGRTIEVLNTDAEGRLILADALSYAGRYEPRAMIDLATLTGACVIALGHHAMALLGTDDAVIAEVRAAADRTGERVWPLPLWDEYREQLRSEVADIKNTGGRPAGTIVAAMFLRDFAGSVPWAHLDIAGTAWADKAGPYQPKGASGVGVRLVTEWVRSRGG